MSSYTKNPSQIWNEIHKLILFSAFWMQLIYQLHVNSLVFLQWSTT